MDLATPLHHLQMAQDALNRGDTAAAQAHVNRAIIQITNAMNAPSGGIGGMMPLLLVAGVAFLAMKK